MTNSTQRKRSAIIGRTFLVFSVNLLFGICLGPLQGIAKADDLTYVTTTSQAFGTLDVNTGAFTQLGTSGSYLEGLGESGGDLYGISSAGAGGATTNELYRINTANGALTPVASTSVSIIEFGSTTSGLFGLGFGYTDLYSINPVNGVATLLGPTGISTQTTSGISVGANSLYLMISSPSSSKLYSLNTSTGASTLVGSSSPGVCLKSMAYEDGTLYDASGYCFLGSKTFTVDPANGNSSFLANVSGFGDLNGMAPVLAPSGPSTPEPKTTFLLGVGLMTTALAVWIPSRARAVEGR